MIDYRAMKREWGHNAKKEMTRRAKWWKENGNHRMAEDYYNAIDEMTRLEKRGIVLEDRDES